MLLLAATAAKGQQPWSFTRAHSGEDVMISDMAWTSDGIVLTCTYGTAPFQIPFTGTILHLSNSGTLLQEDHLADSLYSVTPNVLLSGPDQRLHVLGCYVEEPDSIVGFFHYGCNMSGSVEDSSFILSYSARRSMLNNAILILDGTMILGGSIGYDPNGLFQYSHLLKVDSGGELVSNYIFGLSGLHFQVTQDVIAYNDGLLFSLENFPGPLGKYVKFTDDFNLVDQWFGQSPHPDPNPFAQVDSVIHGPMTLRLLDGGNYIVAGAFVTPDGYTSAIYLEDTTGAVLASFVPHSTYLLDHAALQSTLASIDSNTFYFLSWGGISFFGVAPYEPVQPDELHVYKMDNALNVLCDYVLDGAADSTYYIPTRIKTTPDGGFAILGGKKDMTDPNSNIVGWVQTFSPEECTVGIPAQEGWHTALVHPNPGTDGFEVTLNGSGVQQGRVLLLNTLGEVVAQDDLNGTRGRLECSSLPAGLYLYRIMDGRGGTFATGRWVKQ